MARAIDKQTMLDLIVEAKRTDPETGGFAEWLAEYLAEHLPTLTPVNEAPPCYQPDGDGCSYQCYDGDDEPIDKCKECPLCYSDKQRHHAPPNEWVSVETPPTTQGWYHVAVLDLKSGKYTVEQDLYSIELAKAYGFEPGFCKANRWEERERIDYWCRFPAPPDRRPPEGKEDIK